MDQGILSPPGQHRTHLIPVRLILGCVGMGFLVVFGSGFLMGMWYHNQVQGAPGRTMARLGREATASAHSGEPQQDKITFYETLVASPTAYTPLQAESDTAAELPSLATAKVTPQVLSTAAPGSPALVSVPAAQTATPRHLTTRAQPATQGPDAVHEAMGQPPSLIQNSRRIRHPARTALPEALGQGKRARGTPAGSAPPTPAAPGTRDGFRIQVGSFRTQEQAARLGQRLAQTGHAVQVHSSEVPGQGTRYRVRVGHYATPESARQAAGHLMVHEHVPTMIVR